MTTPPTPADVFAGMLARMPDGARAAHAERMANPAPRDTARAVEDAEDRQARLAAAREHRRAQWDARCPAMFAQARLDRLHPDQHPVVLGRWLDSTHRMLLVHSTVAGNGKSHAAYSLGHQACAQGLWTLAWTMADLNAALRPDGQPGAWEAATGCDVLIVDDLGRERDSEWTQEQLHRLVDHRGREHRRTIITTNLTGAETVTRYGHPVASRLSDDAVIVEFTGKPKRRPAPW